MLLCKKKKLISLNKILEIIWNIFLILRFDFLADLLGI